MERVNTNCWYVTYNNNNNNINNLTVYALFDPTTNISIGVLVALNLM